MKKLLFGAFLSGLLVVLAILTWNVQTSSTAAAVAPKTLTDVERIDQLLGEMKTVDLDKLPAIEVKPFHLPGASVDVMRVRLEETYEVAGVGRDTVELTGWIAAKINDAKPAPGEAEVKWGTAISDTDFIGMELRGNSPKFGPVVVRINKKMPSKGQVGDLSFSLSEALALNHAYSQYREANRATYAAIAAREPVEPSDAPAAATAPATADEKAITRVMDNLWSSLEKKDAKGFTKDFATDFDYPGSARPGVEINNKAEYIADLNQQLANVQSMDVKSQAPRIKVFGKLASVTASGANTVVQKEGESGDTPWRSSVFLKKVGKAWKITQNQIRFKVDTGGGVTQDELVKRAASCRASLSIDVEMPNLDLKMNSEHPVVWYSEVQTITPVGYTASVSLTPTPMLSDGRKVATLEHGAVKFREIVRHIDLQGERVAQLSSR
jgi:hypothetical protein